MAWLSIALPGWVHAAQDNVLSLDRGAAPLTAASRAGQRALASERAQAGDTRVKQVEQQGFIAPSLAAPGPASGVGAKDAPVAAAVPAAPAAPDERPLWNLLKANQLAAYDGEVARLERQFAFWKPGQSLADERARRQREQDLAAAFENGPGALRLMIAHAPEAFGCAHIDRVWKAADVFARAGDRDDVASLYRTIIPACAPAGNRIATLYRAEHQLSASQVDDLIRIEAKAGERTPDTDEAFARLRYERALSALAALPPADPAAATQLADLAPAIRRYRDAPAARQAGWIAFAQHRLDAAADWFEAARSFSPGDADAAIGLAQVRVAQRDWDAADTLVADEPVSADARAKDLRGQIAVARADDAYRAHRYDDSLRELDRAEAFGVPAGKTGALRGWSLYALHRYEAAERAFRARYEASRDDDSAEGLALSLAARRVRVPAHDTGLLGAYGHAIDAQRLYYRKSFIASAAQLRDAQQGPADTARIARYVPAELTGIDAASVSAGLAWSDHIGSSGQGRLDTVAPALRGEWIDGTRQYELRYRQLFLNAGTTSLSELMPGALQLSPKSSPPKSFQNPGSFDNQFVMARFGGSARAEELQAMAADTLRLDGDRALDWRASLGATQGAPAGATIDGQVRIGQQAEWGAWSVYAGVNPVRDSLLSWRGVSLPGNGGTWGAVRRAAGGAQARWQIDPRWSVNAAAEAQWLTGRNVVGNEGASADLSAGYAFDLPGFDYFSAGPAVHVLGYRRNENFYTPGWGGYYSPQRSISSGLALQMLSAEGRTWQWQGNVEAGWNDSLQTNEPCLPRAGFGGNSSLQSDTLAALTNAVCAGSHDHGPYAHAQVSATFKLSPRVQAGALADVNVTPGRDKQFAALAFVRVFFAPRAAVFSRDLARNTRDFFLQLDDDR